MYLSCAGVVTGVSRIFAGMNVDSELATSGVVIAGIALFLAILFRKSAQEAEKDYILKQRRAAEIQQHIDEGTTDPGIKWLHDIDTAELKGKQKEQEPE